MKTLQLIPLFCLLFFNCSGQNKQKQAEDSKIKPDESITVNKEYDEFGNLTRYDSIYSYSYSSNGKLSDSLKLKFQKHFNNHSIFDDDFFEDFFGKDSITGGFYPENFFHNGFINHNKHIENMMKRMDSIQQLFFYDDPKTLIPKTSKKEKTLNKV